MYGTVNEKYFQHLTSTYEDEDQDFASDITPIILAAHVNNYEILKLLLSEGTSLLRPHVEATQIQKYVQ